jgi:hypothetical protein
MTAIAALLLCISCGKQASQQNSSNNASLGNPHMQRAGEWMKLQDDAQAAREFARAVLDEPSNAEAHVGLTQCLVRMEAYKDAIAEIGLVRKLEPKSSRASDLPKLVEDSILQSAEKFTSSSNATNEWHLLKEGIVEGQVGKLLSNLELLREVGSGRSVPFLRSLMGSPYSKLAGNAEGVLRALSPSEVPSTLDALLSSTNTEVCLRTARRLWKEEKSEKAAKVLLQIAESQLKSSTGLAGETPPWSSKGAMEQGLEYLDELGYAHTKNFCSNVVSTPHLYHSDLTTACLVRIKSAHDPTMKDAVLKMMRDNYAKAPPETLLQGKPHRAALEYLAEIQDRTLLPEIRQALGYCFLSAPGLSPAAISLLSKMDGSKWESFSYWYQGGGWPECDRLVMDIDRKRGDLKGSQEPVVDDSPEDVASLDKFFQAMGPAGDFSGKSPALKVERVEVIDAGRITLICSVTQGRPAKQIGAADLIFRGTGNKNRAWVLTKAENMRKVTPPK